jgi:cation diffusion facilitator CzcD-associated flavoprotein CzcO
VTASHESRYCIIGAGPSGLVQARAFERRGIEFDVYERHRDVGGIWDLENPGSPMYDSAHFISSRTMSGFLGFPMPSSYPDYPRRQQILEYLRAFADAYDLRSRISFEQSVERVIPNGEGVLVRVGGRELAYAGAVCATGVNWTPNMPSYPGEFSGSLRHSVSYQHAEEFDGKRVLIIGLGNSGADIACDSARRARATYVSVRRGYHFIPKHIFGQPADVFAHNGPKLPKWLELWVFGWLQRLVIGDTTALGMPKPDHRILESHPLMNDQLLHHLRHGDVVLKPDIARFSGKSVHFTDGSHVEVDEILAATGYQMTLPYLDTNDLETQGERVSHFLSVFSRKHPGLFTLGFVELNGALYPHLDRLAWLIAEYAHARAHDPTGATLFREIVEKTRLDLSGGVDYVNSTRHAFYCDDEALKTATLRTFERARWKMPEDDAWRPTNGQS